MPSAVATRSKAIPTVEEWTGGQNAALHAVFVLLGVTCLAIWGGLLNMLHDLENIVYPDSNMGDSLLATCMTTVVLMNILWISLDFVSVKLMYAACCGITLCCYLLAITVAYIPGTAGETTLHILALFIGICKGTLYPMSFGVAGVMPVDKGSATAMGLGLAGVYSLTLYLTCTVWATTVDSYETLMPPFWIFCCLLSIPSIVAPGLMYYVLHRPWCYGNMTPKIAEKLGLPVVNHHHVAASLKLASGEMSSLVKDLEGDTRDPPTTSVGREDVPMPTGKTIHLASADDCEEPEELERIAAWNALTRTERIKRLVTDCWKPLFSLFWVFFVTLQLYPNVGPLEWGDGRIHSLYMMAAFQLLEWFVRVGCDAWQLRVTIGGRKNPNGTKEGGFSFRPFAMCQPLGANFLLIAVLVRSFIIPLFVLCMYYPENPFWGSLAFHYILAAFTGGTLGWHGSHCVYYAPNSLKEDKPRVVRIQASSAGGLCANLGIWLALWFGKVYTVGR